MKRRRVVRAVIGAVLAVGLLHLGWWLSASYPTERGFSMLGLYVGSLCFAWLVGSSVWVWGSEEVEDE